MNKSTQIGAEVSTGSRVFIRLHEPGDLTAIKQLVFDLHESVRRFTPELPPAENIIDLYLAHLLKRFSETRGTFLVAELEGQVVGYLSLFGLIEEMEPDDPQEPYAYVSDLYVVPRCQGQGIGGLLLVMAEKTARDLGASRLELAVLAGNGSAAAFYLKSGYRDRVKLVAKRL